MLSLRQAALMPFSLIMKSKIDPRKDPIKYMETLPEKRKVCHCDKHHLYQPDCKACVTQWNEFWDIHDRWNQEHKYSNNENLRTTHHGQAKEEAERRKTQSS